MPRKKVFSARTPRKIDKFLFYLPFALLLLWFALKAVQLQSPHQSFADGHIATQLSKGWLEGRPFLYDTYYGFHGIFHNYYFLPLLGPVTWLTGIYGLFLVYLGLMAALFLGIKKALDPGSDRSGVWLSLVIFGLGPLAYFVYVDVFGWHTEQYFLPLSGIAALLLARRQLVGAAIVLFLAALIKESAPVLICGLLLAASITDALIENGEAGFRAVFFQKRHAFIIGGCLVLFCAGLALISCLSPSASRLTQALQTPLLADRAGLVLYLVRLAVFLAVFYAAAILPFLPWLHAIPNGRLLAVFLAAYLLMLGGVYFIEGLLYYPDFEGGLPYPARVGSIWAFFFASYVYLVVRMRGYPGKPVIIYAVTSAFLQSLFSFLLVFNHWPLTEAGKDIGKIACHFLSDPATDPDPDRRLLKELAGRLPRGAEVVAPEVYLSVFHRFYGTRWERRQWLLHRPVLYICHKEVKDDLHACPQPGAGYEMLEGKNISIWIDKQWKSTLLK